MITYNGLTKCDLIVSGITFNINESINIDTVIDKEKNIFKLKIFNDQKSAEINFNDLTECMYSVDSILTELDVSKALLESTNESTELLTNEVKVQEVNNIEEDNQLKIYNELINLLSQNSNISVTLDAVTKILTITKGKLSFELYNQEDGTIDCKFLKID